MAVISISISESEDQVIAGIPKTVSITSNIPATIFYTLDGNDPNLFSIIYTNPIHLPFDKLSVTIKILATNGVDYSPIITETYVTDVLDNTRLPHSATSVEAGTNLPSLYPFGTNVNQPMGTYLSPSLAGITVDNPDLPSVLTGYDGDGYGTGFTNQPFNLENYSIVYTTTNAEGETGHGIGNLPATVKVNPVIPPAEETQQFSNMFDPRAMVIFQDFSKENPDDPVTVNKQFFSLENSEVVRDGNNFFNSGLDSPPTTGSFVKAHYNARDNTLTHYYYDSIANRWIISKAPYQPNGTFDGNLAGIKSAGGGAGSKYVYEWIPFARRVLF